MSESFNAPLDKNHKLAENDKAFEDALIKCEPDLLRQAKRLTNNMDNRDALVKDLVQETLARALKDRGRFEPGTNIGAWTHSILKNAFRDYCRRMHSHGEVGGEDAENFIANAESPNKNAESMLDLRRQAGRVLRGMRSLSDGQRNVLMLTILGDTTEEAAEKLGTTEEAIRIKLSRARQIIRNKLRE